MYAKDRVDGLRESAAEAAGAVTLIVTFVVPVPLLYPLTPAAYIVTAVFAVTVGAVQLNVHVIAVLGVECTSSPLETLVPVPAVNVPAVEATSRPAFPVVPVNVKVKVFLEPEVTVVGPLRVAVGLVPVL